MQRSPFPDDSRMLPHILLLPGAVLLTLAVLKLAAILFWRGQLAGGRNWVRQQVGYAVGFGALGLFLLVRYRAAWRTGTEDDS